MWLGEQDFVESKGKQFLKWRDLVAAEGFRMCYQRRTYWIGNTDELPDDDSIYRVSVDSETGNVRVVCVGLDAVDAEVEGNYDDTTQLPLWMQEKLAVLSMTSSVPPTEPVAGVGRRINPEVYWVFKC